MKEHVETVDILSCTLSDIVWIKLLRLKTNNGQTYMEEGVRTFNTYITMLTVDFECIISIIYTGDIKIFHKWH